MATDNSPPKTRLIGILAFGTVASLVGLRFLFDSYFVSMMEGEAKADEKVSQHEEVKGMRADELAALTSGFHGPASPAQKVKNLEPIDQAMKQYASTPRDSLASITPQPSDNLAPLVGWAKGTKAIAGGNSPAAPAAPAAPPPPEGPKPVYLGDHWITATLSDLSDVVKFKVTVKPEDVKGTDLGVSLTPTGSKEKLLPLGVAPSGPVISGGVAEYTFKNPAHATSVVLTVRYHGQTADIPLTESSHATSAPGASMDGGLPSADGGASPGAPGDAGH